MTKEWNACKAIMFHVPQLFFYNFVTHLKLTWIMLRFAFISIGWLQLHIPYAALNANHTYPILSMEESILSILGCKYVDGALLDAARFSSSNFYSELLWSFTEEGKNARKNHSNLYYACRLKDCIWISRRIDQKTFILQVCEVFCWYFRVQEIEKKNRTRSRNKILSYSNKRRKREKGV
jgi:hypothetical protein